MEKEKDCDYCNLKNESKIMKELDNDEVILFSLDLKKINDYGSAQGRRLLITNKRIYNLSGKKIKRAIKITDVTAMTKNNSDKSLQFVFHVSSESDYRFKISDVVHRDEVFSIVKNNYSKQTHKNLPIYLVTESDLKEFHTVKGDVKKGISRIPPEKYRITTEDVIAADTPSSSFGGYDTEDSKITGARKTRGTLYSIKKGEEVCLEDFTCKKILGKGSFGKVFLVEKKDDKKLYAMKSLRKDVILENDQVESTKLEKDILLKAKHPFFVKMAYIFQTDQKIYFVMNFIRGGELFTHLQNEKRFKEERAKFYAAQIISAIGYLHKKKIIYRDIKPENILMGEDGYLYLADFGLAKEMTNRDFTSSFCGTPEYLAPEIIQNKGHNHAVDWWSIGILIYEMIVGFPPFYHSNQQTMYELIEKFPVKFPDPVKHKIQMSEEVKDLISKLLEKDPKNRLGTDGGLEDIISHSWFEGFDFDKLLKRELEAPFIPKLSDDLEDVSNFDDEFTDQEVVHSNMSDSALKLVNKNKEKFEEFDK
jgi:serum/glucocorticoid-regulated kinase 2